MISCIVCLVLQSLSFIPLKIMFDRIIDKLSIEEEYEFLLKKEEIDKKYFEMMKEHEEHVARIRMARLCSWQDARWKISGNIKNVKELYGQMKNIAIEF